MILGSIVVEIITDKNYKLGLLGSGKHTGYALADKKK